MEAINFNEQKKNAKAIIDSKRLRTNEAYKDMFIDIVAIAAQKAELEDIMRWFETHAKDISHGAYVIPRPVLKSYFESLKKQLEE